MFVKCFVNWQLAPLKSFSVGEQLNLVESLYPMPRDTMNHRCRISAVAFSSWTFRDFLLETLGVWNDFLCYLHYLCAIRMVFGWPLRLMFRLDDNKNN